MERKLELKDIAGYLPYGLKIKLANGFIGEISKIAARDYEFTAIYGNCCSTDWLSWKFIGERHKIILRPLSDLYKIITHNGKEIVPIVELAKICTKLNNGWKLDSKYNNCARNQRTGLLFSYNEEGFATLPTQYQIFNQYQLFDYLHELKIDYRGLVDAGLAIDVNTLDINPYK